MVIFGVHCAGDGIGYDTMLRLKRMEWDFYRLLYERSYVGITVVKQIAEYDNSRRIGDESDRARGQEPSV